MTYLYGHKSLEIEGLQRALAKLGLYRGKIDGGFGDKTRDAVIEAQLLYGCDPHDGVVRADLLLDLGITAPKPPRAPGLFDNIGAIFSIISILKGKTMTSDQVTGAGRAVLGIVITWLVAKGIIPAGSADLVVTAGITILLAGWSIFNNRPSNSAPK